MEGDRGEARKAPGGGGGLGTARACYPPGCSRGALGGCFVYLCTLDPTETTGDGAGGRLGQQQQQGQPSLTWIDSVP